MASDPIRAFREAHPDGCIDVGTKDGIAFAVVRAGSGQILGIAHAQPCRHQDNRAMWRALALAGFAPLRCDEGEDVCDAPCEPGFRAAVRDMVRRARLNRFGATMTPEEIHEIEKAMGETNGP